jgi:hypothetical protein
LSKLGVFAIKLQNTSTTMVALQQAQVSASTPNVNVQLANVDAAPMAPGHDVPNGVYYYYPPTVKAGHSCAVQSLWPIKAFILRPHQQMRIFLQLQTTRPGSFNLNAIRLAYHTVGQSIATVHAPGVVERLALDVRGTVTDKATLHFPTAQSTCYAMLSNPKNNHG